MENIFFINSPLQLLCAIEASVIFKTSNNILVIFNKGSGENYNQIQQMLERYETIFSKVEVIDRKLKSIKGWLAGFHAINQLADKYNRIDNLFIGDYRNGIARHFQNSVLFDNVYILDDGFSTIHIYKRLRKGKLTSYKDYLKYIFSRGKYRFKASKRVNYFTIFDKQITGKNIYSNNLNHLVRNDEWNSSDKIFWLGSPIVEDRIVTTDYYLESIRRWSRELNNKDEIIYFPHRREKKQKIHEIEKKYGFQCNRINVPIELYLVRERVKPKAIISFFSTALYTLNRIMGSNRIYYIPIESSKILKGKKHIQDIYEILNSEVKNINSITL